jgi:hypothetical protein
MYSGGQPYYTTIKMLGQPASYFCVRNDDWQFIAMDTGFNDSNPVAQGKATFLHDTEVEWVKDKVNNANGRKTILLSHHQLFSAFEKIGGSSTNEILNKQLADILPKIAVWFWGHEHNLVIFKRHQETGILGRCIGHGAFPVTVDELGKPDPNVEIENIALAPDQEGALFQHGYVIMEIDGPNATAIYYQFDADSQQEVEIYREPIAAPASAAQAAAPQG